MNKKNTISLYEAREKYVATLFLLDQDVREWQQMRSALEKEKGPKAKFARVALETEFEAFFRESQQIRAKLSTFLALFENMSDN
jgi:hypothetical protein